MTRDVNEAVNKPIASAAAMSPSGLFASRRPGSVGSLCAMLLCLSVTACASAPTAPPQQRIHELNAAARQALDMGDHGSAALMLRDAYALQNNHPDTLDLMLHLHTTMGDDSSAETVALQILQHQPDNARAAERMGSFALRQGRLFIARDYYTRATELDPGLWSAWNGLGIVADEEGDHSQAQAYFLRGLALIPGHPRLLANLGWSLLLAGHYEAAERRLQESLVTAPDVTTTRSNLALAIAMQGRYEDARRIYLTIYDDAVTANNLGIAARNRNELERAREFFQQAVDASPSYYERAATNLEQLRQNNPVPVFVLP
jgi:Flp pilus assembly protein TadD